MSYAKQGNNCYTQSIALTSNEKFLDPNNPIYARILTKHVGMPACNNCTDFSSKQMPLHDDGDINNDCCDGGCDGGHTEEND
jgi:hypothetical protein